MLFHPQGAKLQYGHVAVGTPGDDVRAKHFSSLHAVQRHMVDRNQCKMAFEDNEDEYDDFYEYGDDVDSAGAPQAQRLGTCGRHRMSHVDGVKYVNCRRLQALASSFSLLLPHFQHTAS